jgi:hypothetical protein
VCMSVHGKNTTRCEALVRTVVRPLLTVRNFMPEILCPVHAAQKSSGIKFGSASDTKFYAQIGHKISRQNFMPAPHVVQRSRHHFILPGLHFMPNHSYYCFLITSIKKIRIVVLLEFF